MNDSRQMVGIIGDGQLGMLLCEAAPALRLDTLMLTGNAQGPAAQRATHAVEGAMDDSQAVETLIERCEVITFEREDLPTSTVRQLRDAESNGRVLCYPPLSAVETLQDKAKQKRWLAENDLATLPFMIVDGSATDQQQAIERLGYPVVQKALRGGFDGRGVQLLRDPAALSEAWPGETLYEKYAGQFREIAVLLVRGRDGQMRHFGPVDMTFEDEYAVLDTVCAPAAIDSAVEQRALDLARAAIESLQGVGVFGVEMFLLDDGQVLINEISPRVHNAGHYTLEACASSQFEQHLRAVCGLPLADTGLQQAAAMKNLLCTPVLKQENATHEAARKTDGGNTAVYWYGKSPARLMRKLGHITALAASAADAKAQVEARWQTIQDAAAAG